MKLAIVVVLILCIVGCSLIQPAKQFGSSTPNTQMLLEDQDLIQLGMQTNGTDCQTEEYETSENSPLMQYSICFYTLDKDNTEVVVQLSKFTNFNDLNGSYQYNSLHLRGFNGLISEDGYGDYSRFYVNNESRVYYYHLWIIKDDFLIHVTSKGSENVKGDIVNIGETLLGKCDGCG